MTDATSELPPTREAQARARRSRVAQELGVHPSRISQEQADHLFDRLGTRFMLGLKQTLLVR